MKTTIFSLEENNVLVDDHLVLRNVLKTVAKSRRLKLSVYHDQVSFLNDIENFAPNTNFFFGYQFLANKHLSGVSLAKAVKSRIPCKTFLITSYPSEYFKREIDDGTLDFVFGKTIYLNEPFDQSNLSSEEKKELLVGLGVLNSSLREFEAKIAAVPQEPVRPEREFNIPSGSVDSNFREKIKRWMNKVFRF